MKKTLLLYLMTLGAMSWSNAQEADVIEEFKNPSTTRKFMESHTLLQINRDWSTIAKFKSGYGEVLQFFPVEVIDLQSNSKEKALQLEMLVKPYFSFGGSHPKKDYSYVSSAFVGLDEIDGFIYFLETYVIPNLDIKLRKESKEYIFEAREMQVFFSVNKFEKGKKRFTVKLNNTSGYTFWTESQVDYLPKVLNILKSIK